MRGGWVENKFEQREGGIERGESMGESMGRVGGWQAVSFLSVQCLLVSFSVLFTLCPLMSSFVSFSVI